MIKYSSRNTRGHDVIHNSALMQVYPAINIDKQPTTERSSDAFHIVNIGKTALQTESAAGITEDISVTKRTVILKAGSDNPLMQKLDDHRRDFIEKKGWLPEGRKTDFDRYDESGASTLSVMELMNDNQDKDIIISSLRLTQIENAEDCMSFEMVNLDFDTELSEDQKSKLKQAATDKRLYDLTRLLPPSDKAVSRKDYLESMMKLFGHAMYHTAIEPDQEPIWVCASEPGFRNLLERLGISSEVLKENIQNVVRADRAVLYEIEPLKALRCALDEGDKFAFGLDNFTQGINDARLALVR